MATRDRPKLLMISTALAGLLACAVLLPLLGHHPLAEWDEGIYAEVAREMLRGPHWSGGWLLPHWNFVPWMEKPPLSMWLTAAFYRVFGVSELWARMASALAGVATVAVLHAWMARRLGLLAACLSSVFLLASFGFQHAARTGETDVLLALFLLFALMGVARLSAGERHGWLLFWLGFALALMTKGAASLILLPVVLMWLVLERPSLRGTGRSFVTGFLLFLAITVPWHAYMLAHFGREFVHVYLGWQVMDRATHAIEGHITHGWYYLWVLMVSVPLISLLYPSAMVASWRNERLRVLRPFAVFAVLDLVLFSLVRTRLPHYLCPAYAPLSALAGAFVAKEMVPRLMPKATAARIALTAGGAILLFAGATAWTAHARRELHSPRLADGALAPDDRESSVLLKRAFAAGDSPAAQVAGPLLLWRAGRFVPICSSIFYSHRVVQQVALGGPDAAPALNPYSYNPEPIESAVTDGPRLLLVESSLLAQLPADLQFTPLEQGQTLQLGVIQHRTESAVSGKKG
jgi:4-amino-4-deoxy-L-arabinose transferase-like glycosyltransferase